MALAKTVLFVALLTAASTTFTQALEGEGASPKRNALADIIFATVQPNSWDAVGGEGSLQIVDAWGLAVISQTSTAHDEIEELLGTIRLVRLQQDDHSEDSSDLLESRVVESLVEAAKRRKMEKALSENVDLQVEDSSLAEVAERLSKSRGFPITIDELALGNAGLSPDIEVTIELSDVTLKSALNLMLRRYNLTYTYKDEALVITTKAEAESNLITRVYPVRDLVTKP